MSWEIKSKNNEVKFTVGKVEYNDEWMQERYVTVTIESPVPIFFQIGDYLIYRNERFEINYDPGKIKSAPQFEKGDAFKYENIKFNSLADELTRCDFLDVVLGDNQIHFTGLPKFSFYGGVLTLAERIQANLDRAYGKDVWCVEVDTEFSSDTELNVSIDKQKVSGVLADVLVNQFKTYYTIKGRTLTIGAAGVPADHLFKYGPGQGLYEIEENAEADQQIVTRLRAYGSTRNLPHRYYNSLTGADGAKLIPDNMAVQYLMLPEFPYTTQDPYIDSPNKAALGVREGTIFFDGSNPDLPETYPSIEGMTAEQLKAANVACNATGALDVLVSAEQMTDNGVGKIEGEAFEGNATTTAEPATFKITIKDVGFDINDHIIEGNSEKPTVSFKTGMLGGRDFEISECKKEGSNYVLELNRVYDDDIKLWFPYKDYNAKADDKFVLLNIRMPEVYIKAASQLLKERAQAWLDKNDYSRSVYAPKIDENFMARQHDAAMASGGTIKSLHDTLTAGMQLLFEDEDLGIDAAIFIDRLTIIEGEGQIPTYEVVLKEEKTVGRLEKMQNQIDSLAAGQGQGGGGYNASQIRALIDAYGGTRFLSKLKDDRSAGKISSDKGFEAGEFVAGASGGMLGVEKETGHSFLEVDDVWVRCKAFFESLTVIESETMAGKLYIAPGGSVKCVAVRASDGSLIHPAVVPVNAQGAEVPEASAAAFRCFFLSEQAGEKCETKMKAGDQAISKTFNVPSSQTATQVTNHYWWRLITKVEQRAWTDPETGNVYGYIEVSKSDCAGMANTDEGSDYRAVSDIPAEGDVICQFGSRNTTERQRQTAIVIDTTGSDAPSIKLFCGIDSYTLHRRNLVSYGYDSVKGHAYLRSYGDAYIGDRDGATYLDFNEDLKQLLIKGRVVITSPVVNEDGTDTGKTLGDYLDRRTVTDTSIYFLSLAEDAAKPAKPTKDALGSWSTASPDWESGKAIWQTTRTDYTDGTAEFSDPVRVSGRNGQDGQPGAQGQAGSDGKYPEFEWGKSASATAEPTSWQGTPIPPSQVMAGEYVWQRMRMYDPSKSSSQQEAWGAAVRLTGDKGQAGDSVYLLDLSNEVAGVACDAAGTVTGSLPVSAMTVYKGATADSGWTFTVKSASGCTASISGNTLTITALNADTAYATVEATKTGLPTLEATMNVYKVKPGQTGPQGGSGPQGPQGDAAVVYELQPSVDNVTRRMDGTTSVSSVTCEVYKTTGASTRTKVTSLSGEGLELTYTRNGSTTNSGVYPAAGISVSTDMTSVIFELKKGTTLLDRERIPVVSDGNDLLAVKNEADDAKAKAEAAQQWIDDNAPTLSGVKTSVESLDYLKAAIKDGATVHDGGLALGSLIKVGEWNLTNPSDPKMTAVRAGMNGVIPATLTDSAKRGRVIASWWGGDMVDKFYDAEGSPRQTSLASGYANALVRMDGTGYWCGGLIRFEKDHALFGSEDKGVKIGTDGTFTVGTGVTFNVGNVSGLQSTLTSLANFNAALGNLFSVIDKSGTERDLTYAFTNFSNVASIKAKRGFWSTDFISARGSDDSAGSGGGYPRLDSWSDYNEAAGAVLSAKLGWGLKQAVGDKASAADLTALATRVTSLEGRNYLSDLTLVPSGSGNAVTAVTLSADKKTLTVTKGSTFLTTSSASSTYLSKSEASSTYQPLESGKGLSSNDFTDALLSKLDGIEAGANKYTHPTATATTISAASGKVLSAITVNGLGHVTSVSSKTLVAGDIPTLAISKISGLQTALDSKLEASIFNDLFEKVNIGTASAPVYAIKAKYGFYSVGFVSSRGSDSAGGSGGAGYGLIRDWPSADPGNTTNDALGANLGWWLKSEVGKRALSTDMTALATRVGAAESAVVSLQTASANHVTLDTAQTITGAKTFNANIVFATQRQLKRVGDTSSWVNGRDHVMMRTTSVNGYTPLWSAKSTDGSWDAGTYTSNTFHLSYLTDANYSASKNERTAYFEFRTDGKFVATSLVKSGGTAAQFLKADGSVDSNTYLTTGSAASTYLPKSSYTANDVLAKMLTVDGSGSGLDADLLDGKHDGEVTALTLAFPSYTSSTSDTSNLAIIKEHYTKLPIQTPCSVGLSHGSLSMAFGWRLGGQYNSVDKAHCGWFISNYDTPSWVGASNGVWKSETFAFLSSNVASATKLADNTAFSAWGQTFFENGKPKSVSGNMTGVGSITASDNIDISSSTEKHVKITVGDYSAGLDVAISGNKGIWDWTANAWLIASNANNNTFLNVGNVGIGTTAPAFKLDVNGGIRSTSSNAFRATFGNYGLILRNDGSSSYFLLTNSGDKDGNWNSLRPFTLNNSTGNVGIGNNTLYVIHGSRVGIGTSSPDANVKLHVNGKVRIGSVVLEDDGNGNLKVNGGVWSTDFISARGKDDSAGSGGSLFGLYGDWSKTPSTSDALRADLGKWLYDNKLSKTEASSTYLTQTAAATAYQPKGNYLTGITKSQVEAVLTGNITSHSHQVIKTSGSTQGTSLADFATDGVRVYSAEGTDLGDGLQFSAILSVGAGQGGHRYYQIIGGKGSTSLRWRNTNSDGTALGDVKTLLDTSNYAATLNSAYVKKSGDTMTGNLELPSINVGNGFYGNEYILSPNTAHNNLVYLGKSDGRWANVYATTINVSSNALVTNLNADLLDGLHSSSFARGGLASYKVEGTASGRWIRIAECSSYTSYGTIDITNSYHDNPSQGIKLIVHNSYFATANIENISIVQIGRGGSLYTKARIVYPTSASNTYYVELYYNTSSLNNTLYLHLSNPVNMTLLAAYTAGSVPSGYAAKEFDLVDGVSAKTFKGSLTGNGTPATGTSLTWWSGSRTIGTAAGNAYKGSSSDINLWSFPDGGTAVNGTTVNVMNLRLGWGSTYWADIFTSPNYDRLWYRRVNGGTAGTWHKLAFLDDKIPAAELADRATKLATIRTLWGQNFDGAGNVSGNLSDVGYISPLAGWTYNIGSYVRPFNQFTIGDRFFVYRNLPNTGEGENPTKDANGNNTASYVGMMLMSYDFDYTVPSDTTSAAWHTVDKGKVKKATAIAFKSVHNNSQLETSLAMTPAGRVGIKNLFPSHELDVTGTIRATADLRAQSRVLIGSTGQAILNYASGLHCNVGFYSDSFISCRGQDTSDIRLKTDIRDFNATEIIRKLHPVAFRWNGTARRSFKVFDTDEVQYGLIAQETEIVAPWLTETNMFGDGYMGVRYAKLIPLLAQCQIEQIDEVGRLKAKVKELEARIAELEGSAA